MNQLHHRPVHQALYRAGLIFFLKGHILYHEISNGSRAKNNVKKIGLCHPSRRFVRTRHADFAHFTGGPYDCVNHVLGQSTLGSSLTLPLFFEFKPSGGCARLNVSSHNSTCQTHTCRLNLTTRFTTGIFINVLSVYLI